MRHAACAPEAERQGQGPTPAAQVAVPSTEAKLDGPAIAAIGELGAIEEPCELWIACWDWGS